MVPRQSPLQHSSPAHMACIRHWSQQSRLGASPWYEEGGKRLEIKGMKASPSSLLSGNLCLLLRKSFQVDVIQECFASPAWSVPRFQGASGARACEQLSLRLAPSANPLEPTPPLLPRLAAPRWLRHGRADGGASSYLLTSSSKTHPCNTVSTPVCGAGACSPPSASTEQQSVIQATWRRSTSS